MRVLVHRREFTLSPIARYVGTIFMKSDIFQNPTLWFFSSLGDVNSISYMVYNVWNVSFWVIWQTKGEFQAKNREKMPIFRLFCPKMVTFQAAILQKLIFLCKTKSECSKSRKKSPIWQKNQQNGALFHILPKFDEISRFCEFPHVPDA